MHPSSLPLDLPERLQQRGLQEVEIALCMVRRLKNLPEPPPLPVVVTIREALEDDGLTKLYRLMAWGWEVPEEYCSQLAEMIKKSKLGQRPSNARFGLARKDVIDGVATKPEAGGLGIASMLVVTALQVA